MADLRFAPPNPENSFSTLTKTMLIVWAAANQRLPAGLTGLSSYGRYCVSINS